jgi:soluble lytic murein transglycosylase-like protein
MTSPRSGPKNGRKSRQTVQSNGCLSGFLIPPLIALCFGVVLTLATNGLGDTSQPNVYAAQSANSGSGAIAPLFTPEIQFWAGSITRWAAEHGVDPNLAATVMQIESCGNPSARSSAGAAGLFQVMPFHFLVSENSYDPETNALRGLDYLRRSLERAGNDARLALAGYNGGIGVIGRGEFSWAAETKRYAYWGSGIYADAAANQSESARLNEWLAAGGASLCRKARERLGLQ